MPLKVATTGKNHCFKHRSNKLLAASRCRSIKTMNTQRVADEHSLSAAMDLRWAGYKKYGISRAQISDHYDQLTTTTIINAYNKNNQVIGTLRIVKRASAGLEVEKYLDLQRFDFCLSSHIAEASRFAISCRVNPLQVKILLWKTALSYCREQGIETLLVWVRKGAVRDYLQLLYQSTGKEGLFSHGAFDHKPHQLLYCDLKTLEQQFRHHNHPLCQFFFD